MADGENTKKVAFQITLTQPVKAHGDEVTVLAFRDPTGSDIEMAGMPVSFDVGPDGKPNFVVKSREMTAMMSQLAAVPPSTIKMMTSNDWTTVAWALLGFFIPRPVT